MNNFDDFYASFSKDFSVVCHTLVRLMVSSYFEKHDYAQNCQFWDKLNDTARVICSDLNPYEDSRYISDSELRRRG